MKKVYLPVIGICLALTVVFAFGRCSSTGSTSENRSGASVTVNYKDYIPWDATYDVVVVGFGGAGAVSAITAADAGAKVLLVEKAPEGEEGGNTRYAGQHVVNYKTEEGGITYLKSIRGLFTNWPDEHIVRYIKELLTFEKWWNAFGYTEYETRPRADYPELDGADSCIMYYTELPGKPRFWEGLREQVYKRTNKIDIWYEAPGKELIQDPLTKVILGVKVQVENKTVNVRATNGVILATGGFEANPEMIQDYLQRQYSGALGSLYNTGDGIKMCQAVGADLWHMNATSGPYPAWQYPNGRSYMEVTDFASSHAVIYVGPDGTRFLDESFSPKHGYKKYHGQYMTIQFPLPAWMIFDAASARDKVFRTWSNGYADELAKGWILKADTLDAIAAQIKVPVDNLNATVKEYNGYVAAGKDPLGKSGKALVALGAGPYYALKLTPSNLNTQGGPRRTVECEVLDTSGKVIPNLYAVGELGSMHPGLYQGGGNLGECYTSGRIAGANAAKPKQDPSPAILEIAKQPVQFKYQARSTSVSAGSNEYIGTGNGMGGALQVKVTYVSGKITKVEVVSHHETPGIGDVAVAKLPGAIVQANSVNVDTVSGATLTSNAIKTAVTEALSKAK